MELQVEEYSGAAPLWRHVCPDGAATCYQVSMKQQDIDRFFRVLSQEWPHPTRIILTGGVLARLFGGERPTLDIDFEAQTKDFELFSKALERVKKITKILPQFSADIDHWSQVSLLDYREHLVPYKQFGSIKVFLMDPAHWSIGKIARYYNQDAVDLATVFTKTKPDPLTIAKVWRKALIKSPPSTTLFGVKKNAIHFFKTHGQSIWGQQLDIGKVVEILSAEAK